MGYKFMGPSGSHAEQLRNALHNLRRHVQDGQPLADFYLDVPQLLETAVDYITTDVDVEKERRAAAAELALCPHGRPVSERPAMGDVPPYPRCECCGWLYIPLDGSSTRCRLCR